MGGGSSGKVGVGEGEKESKAEKRSSMRGRRERERAIRKSSARLGGRRSRWERIGRLREGIDAPDSTQEY